MVRPRPAPRCARALVALLGARALGGCDDEGEPAQRPIDPEECLSAPAPPGDAFAGALTETTHGILAKTYASLPAPPDGTPPSTDINGFFVDVDEDGRDEVLVVALAPPPLPIALLRADAPGGPWRLAPTDALPRLESLLAALDLDGDGHVDLITGQFDRAIVWGLGGGRFSRPTSIEGVPRSGVMFSTLLTDLDGDGWLDLIYDDGTHLNCGAPQRSLRVFHRTGPRRFTESPAAIETNVAIADGALFDGWFGPTHAIGLLGRDCFQRWNLFFAPEATTGPGLPHLAPLRFIDRVSGANEFQHPLVSAMGAALGDIDNDGVDELAITGNPVVGVWRGTALPLEDITARTNLDVVIGTRGRALIPWSLVFVDLDRDERVDALISHGTDDPSNQRLVGPQWLTAHWNTGRGRCFREVTAPLGLRVEGDWRSMQVGDLDRDGDMDFVLGGHGHPPLVYRNDLAGPRRGVSFVLRGTSSNALGVGAVVEVQTVDGAPWRRFTAQSTFHTRITQRPEVFVGLGAHDAAARVRVRWPTGYVQELRDVAAGRRHELVEPPLFAVDPPSRQVPPDGASLATITVTPRRPDGSFDAAAAVRVSVAGGLDAPLTPATRRGDAWVATLRAPTSPGETRVEITIDGAAVALHPKVFWGPVSASP